jgi:hypothetical protein
MALQSRFYDQQVITNRYPADAGTNGAMSSHPLTQSTVKDLDNKICHHHMISSVHQNVIAAGL